MKKLQERLIEMKRYPNVRLNTEDSQTLAEAADAIEALQATATEYQQAADKMAMDHKVERDTLRQQLAEAQKDAERYRWLRQARSQHAQVMTWADGIDEWVVWHTAEDVDTSIDAAMKGTA